MLIAHYVTRVLGRSGVRATLLALAIVGPTTLATAQPTAPRVLGWLEVSYLQPQHIRVKTKLDSGARTSSLHAVNVQYLEKDGEPWVKFHTPVETRKQKTTVIFELPVVDTTRIKEHDGSTQYRYVVELSICLDGEYFNFPATLSDRSHFNYELLLGRNMLAGAFVIDPARTFTSERTCDQSPPEPSS